jgi:anti-sigma-K factor RskA
MAMENDSLLQAANYVDGEMDAQEQKDFELQMQSDAELRQYVEQYRQASIALSRHLVAR